MSSAVWVVSCRHARARRGDLNSQAELTLPFSHSLIESGGDWDRRNRLKAYEGLYLLSIRNFATGAQLLLDTLSTFTATELIDYDDFVKLVVVAGTLTLERKELKKKVGPVRLGSALSEAEADFALSTRLSTHPK